MDIFPVDFCPLKKALCFLFIRKSSEIARYLILRWFENKTFVTYFIKYFRYIGNFTLNFIIFTHAVIPISSSLRNFYFVFMNKHNVTKVSLCHILQTVFFLSRNTHNTETSQWIWDANKLTDLYTIRVPTE